MVELGSFSEAGRQLRLSRSAVSKYVGDLEQNLGVQLLNRTTRHASPNEKRPGLFRTRVEHSVGHRRRGSSGGAAAVDAARLLRVNAPMSFGTLQLGSAVADFMERYPSYNSSSC